MNMSYDASFFLIAYIMKLTAFDLFRGQVVEFLQL